MITNYPCPGCGLAIDFDPHENDVCWVVVESYDLCDPDDIGM